MFKTGLSENARKRITILNNSNDGIKRLYNLDLGVTLDANGLVMGAAAATVSSDGIYRWQLPARTIEKISQILS